jgi:integrase/recombinase XerD
MAGIADEQIIDDYVKDLELRGGTQKTIENYSSCVGVYKDWLNSRNQTLLSVESMADKDIIEDFLYYLRKERKTNDGGNISYARIKVYFSALNNLYDYLSYNRYVKNNIILTVRKRYLKQYKNGYTPAERKILDVQEMSKFLNNIMNLRDKTIALLFVKTGIRRQELIEIDVEDVNLEELTLIIKDFFHKRSNRVVFFDDETKRLLMKWLKRREQIVENGEKALFVGDYGRRINKNYVYDSVVKWAKRIGYYNTDSNNMEEHFSCHNLRHCFTTYLSRNGMPREYIKELRGDKRTEIIDIYNHIDRKELKREYLSCMPKFNVF